MRFEPISILPFLSAPLTPRVTPTPPRPPPRIYPNLAPRTAFALLPIEVAGSLRFKRLIET
eukprot:1712170-Pyramimonas_sp.AAC.1